MHNRHVQRCRVLIHVVNGDSPDPVGDYLAINQVRPALSCVSMYIYNEYTADLVMYPIP